MTTWRGRMPTAAAEVPVPGRLLAALRVGPLALWIFGLLAVHGLVRVVERPLCGAGRPVTPWITVAACRGALAIMGIRWRATGPGLRGPGAVVANHGTWIDIFALNATGPVCFVSKSDVAGWPGIGLLARATGTIFVNRDRREAGAQRGLVQRRLAAGQPLVIFPEGTSSDTLRVLPFKSTLFGSFFAAGGGHDIPVQPVTLIYRPPEGAPADFFGWWGDMDFGADLVKHLARRRGGAVEVRRHDPLRAADFPDRKALSRAAETVIRAAHREARGLPDGAVR